MTAPRARARIFCHRRATVRGVSTETAVRPQPLRLTQARIGDTLHDGNGTRVAIVNAFTTVNPETEATVRAVDYQVVGAAPNPVPGVFGRRGRRHPLEAPWGTVALA